MALIKCKECGKNISENARVCPDCGEPINATTLDKEISALKKFMIFGIIFLIIIIILAFIFGYFIPSHTYTTLKDGIQVKEFRLF